MLYRGEELIYGDLKKSNKRVFIEGKIPRIILKGSQLSSRIFGNLARFAIRGGLIRGLSTKRKL